MSSTGDAKLLGSEFRKIHPKLRMVAKAKDNVNFRRAEQCSAMCAPNLKDDIKAAALDVDVRIAGKVPDKDLTTPTMQEISDTVEVNTFVSYFGTEGAETARIESKRIRLNDLRALAGQNDVSFIELGEPLKYPDAIVSAGDVSPPSVSERNIPGRDSGGHDVLIGIIDVGGFDFSHPDFTQSRGDQTTTRWVRIWDQREGLRPNPEGFDYGSEIHQDHMNAALNADVSMPAWALEPQSQMTVGSHGTHVASIAAGNRGVCRNADIAGVLIDLPEGFSADRRNSGSSA